MKLEKEKVINIIVEFIEAKSESYPEVDIGELLLFLEENDEKWLPGGELNFSPVREFMRANFHWSSLQLDSLEETLYRELGLKGGGTNLESESPGIPTAQGEKSPSGGGAPAAIRESGSSPAAPAQTPARRTTSERKRSTRTSERAKSKARGRTPKKGGGEKISKGYLIAAAVSAVFAAVFYIFFFSSPSYKWEGKEFDVSKFEKFLPLEKISFNKNVLNLMLKEGEEKNIPPEELAVNVFSVKEEFESEFNASVDVIAVFNIKGKLVKVFYVR